MTAPLDALFAALEAALAAGDDARARDLAREIGQRLATDAADAEAKALRLRELTSRIAAAPAPRIAAPLTLDLTRDLSPAASPGVDYPVFFATNRKPTADGGFGPERGAETIRGRALVHVPQAHRFGETGSGFWRRFWSGDDRLRLKEIARRPPADFYAEIAALIEAARDAGDEPEALVFLHGFNVSFADAMISAAQIGYDLRIPGATAVFSWPSRGEVVAYPADEATIEASEGAIADFLVEFAKSCGAAKLHLIAHSMGNRGLLRALQRIGADATARANLRFHQIVLAAPDVDRDLFLGLAHLYSAHCERATLYASDADLPVHLSARLHAAPRAGYFEPYTVAPGVDTVAVPDLDIDWLGHGYFAAAEALLHDIFDLLRFNLAPSRRLRVEPLQADGLALWRLRR